MIEIIKDTLIDALKILPFLFVTYLIMESLEHKTGNKTKQLVKKSGKLGPLFGSILGIFPQCGFSAVAASLYAGRVITLGTLIAVFLSTSDEMLPILISESAPIELIVKVLAIKLIIGIIAGFIVDILHMLIFKKLKKEENDEDAIEDMCEHEHCDCEHGIVKSAIKHTINILAFIIIITFLINMIIYFIGEDNISNAIAQVPIAGILVSALIGFIPNCAGSVIITELYLSNLISLGSMMAGLLVGSGIGILVLFRTNKNVKDNLKIMGILYVISIISGLIIDLIL
ncbi:MAG: putative manganese transporter [Christensenellales bacterium]